MTALAVPGCLDPQPGRWGHPLADLAGVGVSVEEEQACLLDPDVAVLDVLVAHPLPDPLANVDGLRYFSELPPLVTVDDGGHRSTVVVPVLGRLDWEGLEFEPDWSHGQDWWEFPSVPVRLVVPDAFDECDEMVRMTRVWNAWALPGDGEDKWEYANVSETLAMTGWYAKAKAYAKAARDPAARCALSPLYFQTCLHTQAGDCLTGPMALDRLAGELFLGGAEGFWRPPHLQPGFTSHTAADIWARLSVSSRRNSYACLGAAPDWERTELARREGRFSPWVLS